MKEIDEKAYSAKVKSIAAYCEYKYNFCDGTPNMSIKGAGGTLPPCKYYIDGRCRNENICSSVSDWDKVHGGSVCREIGSQ